MPRGKVNVGAEHGKIPRELDCEREAHIAETDDADADIDQGRQVHSLLHAARQAIYRGKPNAKRLKALALARQERMAYSRTRANANGRKPAQTMETQIVKQKFAILAVLARGCRPFDRKL